MNVIMHKTKQTSENKKGMIRKLQDSSKKKLKRHISKKN